jgi:hypothetical protein
MASKTEYPSDYEEQLKKYYIGAIYNALNTHGTVNASSLPSVLEFRQITSISDMKCAAMEKAVQELNNPTVRFIKRDTIENDVLQSRMCG